MRSLMVRCVSQFHVTNPQALAASEAKKAAEAKKRSDSKVRAFDIVALGIVRLQHRRGG